MKNSYNILMTYIHHNFQYLKLREIGGFSAKEIPYYNI